MAERDVPNDWRAKLRTARARYAEAYVNRSLMYDKHQRGLLPDGAEALRLAQEAEAEALQDYQQVLRAAAEQEGPL